jgi:hypothetical protein
MALICYIDTYIHTNKQTEVQAFLTKYPNATVSIERSSDVLVTHSISKSVHEGKPIDRSSLTAAIYPKGFSLLDLLRIVPPLPPLHLLSQTFSTP